jgi:hypothetical protein
VPTLAAGAAPMLLHRWSHHPSLHPSIYAAEEVL